VAQVEGAEQIVGEIAAGHRYRVLGSAEQVARLGSWEWFPKSDEQSWSDNLYRIFGVEPGEVVPTQEFVLEQTHPDDREKVAAHVESLRHVPSPPPLDWRIIHPDRGVSYLRSTMTATEWNDRGATRIVGAVQDVTDEWLANCEIAAHVAVSKALASWDGFDVSARSLLRGIASAMDFVFAALWLPDRDVLRARLVWGDPSVPAASELEAEMLRLRVPRGSGLLGRVWERLAPVDLADVLPDYDYHPSAAAAGLRGGVAFPALHADEVLAVLEFYCPTASRLSSRLSQTMSAIGNELGEFLSRHQGELYASPLTPRELQTLQLAADGCSRTEIAVRLGVSPATIATHMKHIFEGLGVHDRASAVATGIRLGLIE
jgi:DNA-binding CsgD family transcriptional regulator